jgi:hypothetical protein
MESVMQVKLKITVITPKFIPAFIAKLKVRTTKQNPMNLVVAIMITPNKLK